MSVPTFLQSRFVPFAVGLDGITYKNAVCKKLWGLTITPTIVEDPTDCGIAIGTGAVKFSFNVQLAFNLTPNGSTELSANEFMNYVLNGTTVYVLLQAAAPNAAQYIRRGAGLISNLQEQAPQGGTIDVTCTITGVGTLAVI